jgi:thiamine-phosphate pyrophosphorylase
MKSISRLQYITTNATHAEQACIGGVDWVQLRLKDTSYDTFLKIAREVQLVCKQFNTTFIINDNVSIAKEICSDGVHLGKEDMSPEKARAILGDDFIIGCTANNRRDILNLSKYPVNYIGLGPFRFTTTKKKIATILGLAGYTRIMESLSDLSVTNIPVLGIGGITEADVEAILSTDIYGIAVSGAISNAKDVTIAAKKFKGLVSLYSENTILK